MKKPKAPQLVTVAIFTTITVIFWVFLSVYRVLTKASPPEVPAEILAPISPNLDINALNNLEGRVFFEETEVIFPGPSSQTIPSPTFSPTLEPTTIPTLSPT